MKILGIRIRNFRNLEETELEFSPRINLFLGENGQGKTNLLEAINLMALGRSHRGSRGEEMIRFDAAHLHVALSVEPENEPPATFEFAMERGGARKLKIDEQIVRNRTELVGRLTTVFFSPESIGLVRGGPERRRRFVDEGLAGLDRDYLFDLQSYVRALRQKTRLLRGLKTGRTTAQEARPELEAWNRKMAPHAASISRHRRRYGEDITPCAAREYSDLAGESSALEFVYKPKLAAAKNVDSQVQLERDILAEFDYIIEDEMRRGRPLSGPQMDDFEVRLSGLDLRTYGSQGETRTAAVSLIIAQSDVVYQTRSIRPVLFFDDIFSELDRKRSRQLQEKSIRDHQVFIATARKDDVDGWHPDGMRIWEVEAGKLREVA